MNKPVVFTVLLLLSLNVLAQTPGNQTAPPQTTSVQALLEKLTELQGDIAQVRKDNAEMRTQFDAKLERIRQSDQLFYLFFNLGSICLFVVASAIYERAMFSRRKKEFVSIWDRVGEQVKSFDSRLGTLTANVDVLVRRISEMTPPEKASVAGDKPRKGKPWGTIILLLILWFALCSLVFLALTYFGVF